MSKTKKIISLILMVVLVMTMATVAIVSTSAATKVYFEDSYSWGNIHAYCYGGSGEILGYWPGTACQDEGNGVWSIELSSTPDFIIFHGNDDTNQTSNIPFAGENMIAKLTGEWIQGDYKMVAVAEFSVYSDAPATEATTVATEATTQATEATTQATEATTQTPVAPPAATGIDVDGTIYNVAVGTTVNYTVDVTAAQLFEDVQAYVTYDSEKLELVKITSDKADVEDWEAAGAVRCPNLGEVYYNEGIDGIVKFNGSEVFGYDFTEGKTLVTLQFVVKDTAYSAIDLIIEEMSIKGGKTSYFADNKAVVTDGITIKETLDIVIIESSEDEPTEPVTTEPATTEAPTTEAPTTEAPTTEATEPATTVPAPATTDATGATEAPATEKADTPVTGATSLIYVALAMMAMAACAVVVLRKKVNG